MKPIFYLIRFGLFFSILLQSCGSKNTVIVNDKDSTIQKEPIAKPQDNFEKWKRRDEVNDSIGQELLKKFPNALNIDSLRFSYSIFLQRGLERSHNIIYISRAYIKDIREYNGKYIITTFSYSPKIITQLFLEPTLANDLLKKIEKGFTHESCCIIADIKKFFPMTTNLISRVDDFSVEPGESRVREEDIQNYIHLELDAEFSPTFVMNGSILELRIF